MGAACSCCTNIVNKFTNTTKQQVRLEKKRSCTDIAFLVLYFVAWIMFIINFAQSKELGGNPLKITRGVDYLGRICGFDNGVQDQPFGAWPYPLEPSIMVCVKDCHETSIPDNPDFIWSHSSTEYMQYCIPYPNGTVSVQVNVTMTGDFLEWWNSAGASALRAVGDVSLCSGLISVSVVLSLVASFIFVNALRYVAGTLIGIGTMIIVMAGVMIGIVMWTYSKTISSDAFMGDSQRQAFEYGGYVMWGLTALFLLVILALRTQILIAVEVVKEAARALLDMKELIIFPILPLIGAAVYFAMWFSMGLWIYSVSDLVSEPMPESMLYTGGLFTEKVRTAFPLERKLYRWNENYLIYNGFIHLFHGLWTIQFVLYFSYAVMVGALASWYFTPRDKDENKLVGGADGLEKYPILQSCLRTLKYHIGTIALCAMIIAIIQTLRAAVRYIEWRLKGSGKASMVAIALLRMLQCCLKCAECCMDKINKNALVWMAIYGNNMCVSTCSSFALIWRNLWRFAAINTVSAILLAIGKLSVALSAMCICGIVLAYVAPWKNEIFSPAVPALLIFVLAYFVASMFMTVFEAIIDATFFCFLVDVEQEKGMMLAHSSLQKLVGKYAKQSKKDAELQKMSVDDMDKQNNLDEEQDNDEEPEKEEEPIKKSHKKRESENHGVKPKKKHREGSPDAENDNEKKHDKNPAKKRDSEMKRIDKGDKEKRGSKHHGHGEKHKKKQSRHFSDGDLDG